MATDCDPLDLFSKTNCFQCLTAQQLRQVMAYLLCQIEGDLSGGGGGGGIVLQPWTPGNSPKDVSHISPGGDFQNVLGGLSVFNSGGTDLFIFVYGNGATYPPVNNSVPDLAPWPVYGGSSASIPIPVGGALLPGSGMLFCLSSTGNGFTAPVAPNVGTYQYFVKPV